MYDLCSILFRVYDEFVFFQADYLHSLFDDIEVNVMKIDEKSYS
jgi:hypothetical protein